MGGQDNPGMGTIVLERPHQVDRQNMSLYNGAMKETVTIRVSVLTRDLLAEMAKWRGESLSAYLSSVSQDLWREEIIKAAREEAIMDEKNPAAKEEYELWEETLLDGID